MNKTIIDFDEDRDCILDPIFTGGLGFVWLQSLQQRNLQINFVYFEFEMRYRNMSILLEGSRPDWRS